MKLILDPPSGHSDSYLDVSFKVETDMSDKIEIQFFNITANEPLEILSVTQGYIFEEYTVITKNTNVVEGFINIFNKDKMNEKLKDYIRVEIKCITKMFKGETDGIIIFILRHKYGVSHTELSKIYNKSIPSISIKYNKIAKMKRDGSSNKKILIFDIIDNFVNK